ncbi:uncharacterized protein A4U43_C06F3090 [Asparagus officinalis]|uniref:HTH myb-type domain-containing protein n=1 Tax=Asparagus officinalis TaxID=4686 RepID=A0A5P1EJP3_ASPOF|nr:uncharacterized protein A4U43_C06F3090 [Asparagus officinalis]
MNMSCYNGRTLDDITDNLSLLYNANDSNFQSTCSANLADVIPSQSSMFPINMQEQYPSTGDIHNQEPTSKNFESILLNDDTSYKLDESFDSDVVMDALLSDTVNQSSETHYMNVEINEANLEAEKFLSPFELSKIHTFSQKELPNIRRVEVAKPRMRWTPELHERFVQAINQLGGPDRTTPRSILIKMGIDGITVDHVKSHLQKYRLAKYQPEAKQDKRVSCLEGKKRNSNEKDNKVSKLSSEELGMLQTQWQLQKTLHDQLKITRELHLQTKENARRFQEFVENQSKLQEAFMQATQSLSSTYTSVDDGLLNHNHTDESCFVESNGLRLAKKARFN